jgi:hypothetical protein
MERGKKTSFILRQFKRKVKKVVYKDYFTELFYLNKNRGVIEFLLNDNEELVIDVFFKEFIPTEFREFVQIKLMNIAEEEIRTWYYNDENLVLVVSVNWGIKKEEISIELDITNFVELHIDNLGVVKKEINYTLLNDYLISFLTLKARELAKKFEKISSSKLESDLKKVEN